MIIIIVIIQVLRCHQLKQARKKMKNKFSLICKFSIGDKVRISKYKRRVFDKGYTPNWTEEVFVIDHVMMTKPVTYNVVDLLGEKFEGSFYEKELQKAKQQTFRIEKVVKRDNKKKKALVKWKGYSNKFNS